jgi:hypothetical protein
MFFWGSFCIPNPDPADKNQCGSLGTVLLVMRIWYGWIKMACFREEQYDWLGVYDHFSGSLGSILSSHYPSDSILHLGRFGTGTVLLNVKRCPKFNTYWAIRIFFSFYFFYFLLFTFYIVLSFSEVSRQCHTCDNFQYDEEYVEIFWEGSGFGSTGLGCRSQSGSAKMMPIRPDPDPQHCCVP